jgi:hypothetical protein
MRRNTAICLPLCVASSAAAAPIPQEAPVIYKVLGMGVFSKKMDKSVKSVTLTNHEEEL